MLVDKVQIKTDACSRPSTVWIPHDFIGFRLYYLRVLDYIAMLTVIAERMLYLISTLSCGEIPRKVLFLMSFSRDNLEKGWYHPARVTLVLVMLNTVEGHQELYRLRIILHLSSVFTTSVEVALHFRIGLKTEETDTKTEEWSHGRGKLRSKNAGRIDQESYTCTGMESSACHRKDLRATRRE